MLPLTNQLTSTKRASLGIVLAVLGLLASLVIHPAIASAQPDDPTVEGRGALWARGDGDVAIEMHGRFTASVAGDVEIIDHAGDLTGRIRFDGDARVGADEPIGDAILNGFDGQIHLRGSDFSVIVTSGEVGLRAIGQGQATLTGDGLYRTRNGEKMAWDGLVRIGDPQVQPA